MPCTNWEPVSLSALWAQNCREVSACPLGNCVCETDGRTRHANDNLIIPARPPGLRAPSASSSCASRYVRSTWNLTLRSFAWQVTLLPPSFPLWQCHRPPKWCHSGWRGEQPFDHGGLSSSQCDWNDPSLEQEPEELSPCWDTALSKPQTLTVPPVLQWLQARLCLCMKTVIFFFFKASWHSFSFKYTGKRLFQIIHFSVLFQALDTSIIIFGLHLCGSMVCSLWEKENQVERNTPHGPEILCNVKLPIAFKCVGIFKLCPLEKKSIKWQ